jgi:hypothetical protein
MSAVDVEFPRKQLWWNNTPHPCIHEKWSRKSLTEQCDGVIAKDDDPYSTDEKWLRESDIREKNTIQQNKNFV